MTKIMIFPIYHRNEPVFQNEIVCPIGVGESISLCDEMLSDCTEDNIADKHPHYAELTAHYWIWKNIIPKKQNDFIGFCHYRRFLGIGFTSSIQIPVELSCVEFQRCFDQIYTAENISKSMAGFDIILPYQESFKPKSIYEQYLANHPTEDLEETIRIIREKYSEYEPYIQKIWKEQKSGYFRLSFLMRSDLFSDWCSFCFGVLFELEQRRDWSTYTEYNNQRIAGFIAERLFNLWIAYQVEHKNIKVKEVPMFFLTDAMSKEEKADYVAQQFEKWSNIFGNPSWFEYKIVWLECLFSLGKRRKSFKRKKEMMKELRWKAKVKASLKNE